MIRCIFGKSKCETKGIGEMNSRTAASQMNYLKAVQKVTAQKGYARNIDVAHELNYKAPSVSIAVRRLCELGYLEKGYANLIFLTERGLEQIRQINNDNQEAVK